MGTESIPKKDRWFFGGGEPLLEDKGKLIDYHFGLALARTLTMFEYTGLPETIPYRELEKIVQLHGFAYWLQKDGKLYVFYGGLGGRPNEYYQPTQFIVANPYLKFFDVVEVNERGVLMWNDYSHMGLWLMIRRYAELMAECDITLRFGLINDRLVSVFYANDDNTKASAEALIKDVTDGKKIGVVMGTAWKDDATGDFRVDEYRKASVQDIKAVMELQQYIKASFWNDIGIQANYNMKREAINGSEAGMNEESLKPFVDEMLRIRKEAVAKVNAMYGTNIGVEFSSSWVRRERIVEDETEEGKNEKPEEEPRKEEGAENGND